MISQWMTSRTSKILDLPPQPTKTSEADQLIPHRRFGTERVSKPPPYLVPHAVQSFGKANNYACGEVFEDSGPGSTNHQMNWITWAIGAGNAAMMGMTQGKLNGIHQDLTNQNTTLHTRINYLEQANANQSRQIQNLQKRLEECDSNAIEGLSKMFSKLQGNIGAGLTTSSVGTKIA
jgi:hypothetical protein